MVSSVSFLDGQIMLGGQVLRVFRSVLFFGKHNFNALFSKRLKKVFNHYTGEIL